MEHADEIGGKLSVHAERKHMVIKQQLQVTNFVARIGKSLVGNPAITYIQEWFNWLSQTKVT